MSETTIDGPTAEVETDGPAWFRHAPAAINAVQWLLIGLVGYGYSWVANANDAQFDTVTEEFTLALIGAVPLPTQTTGYVLLGVFTVLLVTHMVLLPLYMWVVDGSSEDVFGALASFHLPFIGTGLVAQHYGYSWYAGAIPAGLLYLVVWAPYLLEVIA